MSLEIFKNKGKINMKSKSFLAATVSLACVASVVAPIATDAATGKSTVETNIKDIRLYSATKVKVYYSKNGKTVSKDITLSKPIKHLSTYGIIPWEGKNIRWNFNDPVQLPQQKSYAKYIAQAKSAIEKGDVAKAEASLAIAKQHLSNMDPAHFSSNLVAKYQSNVVAVENQVEEIKVSESPSVPVIPETPSVPSYSGGTVVSNSIEIERVQNEPGKVMIILNQPTTTAITKDAISILCNSGGSDMTILNVTTKDNQVYEITTAYYKDAVYEIYMNLPNGATIRKTFEVRANAPLITATEMERINEGTAEFFFQSDAQGSFYYLLKEKPAENVVYDQASNKMYRALMTRATNEIYGAATTIDISNQLNAITTTSGIPTAAQIKSDGVRTDLKFQANTVRIQNLKPDTAYEFYCLAVDEDGRESVVQGPISIAANPAKDTQLSEIQIIEASATDRYFEITLDQVPKETLTLEHFSISCPATSLLHLGKVEKLSDTKYRVYMKENYFFVDKNNYTIIITYNDRTVSKHKFYVDLSWPEFSLSTITRKSATSATFDFRVNEDGYMWYVISDVDDIYNTKLTVDEVIRNGKKISFKAGSNMFDLEGVTENSKSLYFVSEDMLGNRPEYVDALKISSAPTIEPEQPDENTVMIANIQAVEGETFAGFPCTVVEITFSDNFNQFSVSTDTITIRQKNSSSYFTGYRDLETALTDKNLSVAISKNMGTILEAGTYEIVIQLDTGEEVRADFVVQ